MLEIIHEYATERAAEHPAGHAEMRRRHAAHHLAFAQEAEPRIRSTEQLLWLPCVDWPATTC